MEDDKTTQIVMPKRVRAPEIPSLFREIRRRAEKGLQTVDFRDVEDFDTSTLAFLNTLRSLFPILELTNIKGSLAEAEAEFLAEKKPVPAETVSEQTFSSRTLKAIADGFLNKLKNLGKFLVMLGDEVYHLGGYIKERKGVYPGEIWNQMFFMGYRSFPIVAVLIFLVGVTISWTSAAQLKLYGADIYLADFVGYAMLNELVPLMTGVILSGKVGAAVAAELSSMTVLEEVDALRTMGVVPEKYLMVPRIVAITLVVPLLVAMADVVGIFGGILVGRITFGTPPSAFLREMMTIVDWTDFFWGMVKSVVFGWAVVIASGYKGLTVGRSAGEVGRATTESVVLSISLIILIDCVFAFILY
jgi:phospholipid/cholesterol/gamma-HCH transport system permease protein